MSRTDGIINKYVSFADPKTKEILTGKAVGIDPRPYGKRDGLYVVVQLPNGEVVTPTMKSCSVIQPQPN